jgi:hypothetical protein
MTFQIWQLMCQQPSVQLLTHQLPYLEGHVTPRTEFTQTITYNIYVIACYYIPFCACLGIQLMGNSTIRGVTGVT